MTAEFAIASPHGSAHDGKPELLAHYRDLDDVRGAMQRLEARGVDGDDLALLGNAALETEKTTDRTRTDARFLSSVSGKVLLGILIGAAGGTVFGALLVGASALLWTDMAGRGWVFGLMVAWFAAGGAILGAFAGVFRAIGFSESIPLTFEDEPKSPVWLGVYCAVDDRVLDTIQATRPIEIIVDSDTSTTHPDNLSRTA